MSNETRTISVNLDLEAELEAQILVRKASAGWECECRIEGEDWAKVWSPNRGRAVLAISRYVSQL